VSEATTCTQLIPQLTQIFQLKLDEASNVNYYFNLVTGEASWETPPSLLFAASDSVSPEPDPEPVAEQPPLPLPVSWEERIDAESGATYYYNTETQEAAWERPENIAKTNTPWEERLDEASGAQYYFNTETQVAQWDMPPDLLYCYDGLGGGIEENAVSERAKRVSEPCGKWKTKLKNIILIPLNSLRSAQANVISPDCALEHTPFSAMASFANVKLASSQWARCWLQLSHDISTNEYHFSAAAKPNGKKQRGDKNKKKNSDRNSKSNSGDDDFDDDGNKEIYEKFSFELKEVSDMKVSNEQQVSE